MAMARKALAILVLCAMCGVQCSPDANPPVGGMKRAVMKAVHLTQWCAQGTVPDAILFGDVPVPPAPVKREVLISVKASSINIDDIAVCQDTAAGGWLFHARTPSAAKPLVGGCEYAGVVLACGPGCTKLKVGDRVCGVQDIAMKKLPGTWAEQTLAPEDDIVPMPAGMSFVDAAAVGMAAFVAGDMYRRARLPATGGRCLVLGASGGLGSVLLQLLRKRTDLHVVAVCSEANAAMVRRWSKQVVDYTKAPFEQQLAAADKFDVVFDFVGGSETEQSAKTLLRRGGQFITAVGPWKHLGDRLLTCVEWSGWACGLLGRLVGGCLPFAKVKYELGGGMPPLKVDDFNAVAIEAGARGLIALEVPFSDEGQVREALRRVATRRPGGKVLINLER
jgi:alcohol dehydrogenase